jgi:hypothetical protein
VLAIAFELVIPVQTIVFMVAPLMGAVIGAYANVRSDRWRPRGRVLVNAVYAGLVTGVALALIYVAIRLVFIYGDTGALPNGTSMACQAGPACAYQRYINAGEGEVLASRGIHDAATFENAMRQDLTVTGVGLVALTVGGALVGGLARSFSSPPKSVPLPTAARRLRPRPEESG